MNQVNRNARCHCGSGKKYKNCHGAAVGAPPRRIPVGLLLGGLAVAVVVLFIVLNQTGATTPPGAAPPGKVWSEEHGHWHDAP